MRAVAVTTEDNPYDPLDDFENWYGYDMLNGYNTCSRLSRITDTADSLSDELNLAEIERGVDFMVKNDFVISRDGKILRFRKVERDY